MTDVVKLIEEKENAQKRTFHDFLLDLFDIIAFLIFVGGIISFIRFFLFNPYTVVGQSMEPTFDEKDFIIVDKMTPRFGEINRGDVIVFVPPGKDVPYIKRVIGIPGDIIKINNGTVLMCSKTEEGENCEKLKEEYLPSGTLTEPTCNLKDFEVTSGSYFVLGDNREHSTDSRCCFGLSCYNGANYLVPHDYIIGKVYVRIFPGFRKF